MPRRNLPWDLVLEQVQRRRSRPDRVKREQWRLVPATAFAQAKGDPAAEGQGKRAKNQASLSGMGARRKCQWALPLPPRPSFVTPPVAYTPRVRKDAASWQKVGSSAS